MLNGKLDKTMKELCIYPIVKGKGEYIRRHTNVIRKKWFSSLSVARHVKQLFMKMTTLAFQTKNHTTCRLSLPFNARKRNLNGIEKCTFIQKIKFIINDIMEIRCTLKRFQI